MGRSVEPIALSRWTICREREMTCRNAVLRIVRRSLQPQAPGRAAASALLLAACSGSTGPAGPAGAGGRDRTDGSARDPARASRRSMSPRPPPSPAPSRASRSAGRRWCKFKLADQNGVPLKGLPAADLGLGDRAARAGPKRHVEPVEFLHLSAPSPHRGARRGVAACDTTPQDAGRRSKAPPAARWSTMATAPISTPSRPTSRRCRPSPITRP